MICTACKKDKPRTDFEVSTTNRTGYFSRCKDCCLYMPRRTSLIRKNKTSYNFELPMEPLKTAVSTPKERPEGFATGRANLRPADDYNPWANVTPYQRHTDSKEIKSRGF